MDTNYKANGNIEISLIENKLKIKDFKNIKKHTLLYEEHNYVRNLAAKKDIKNLSKNDLTKKLRDYKYRYNYLKEISLSNNNIGINNEKLKEFFINEFGNLNYNFNNLSEKEKSDII